MNVFTDHTFLSAVEHWFTLRERPLERERDYVFCGYMFACFDDLDAVRVYLNYGHARTWVERAFVKARDNYYEKGLNERL